LPVGDAVGQELGPRGLDLPADLARYLDDRAAQHLGVQFVGAGHDFGLHLEEARQEGPLLEAEAVLGRLLLARFDDPLLPVDLGSVAVGGYPLDGFETREGHGARHLIGCRPRSAEAPKTWTSSSTRASSFSPRTASPCRAARSPRPSPTRWPRRSGSATPAQSRPR